MVEAGDSAPAASDGVDSASAASKDVVDGAVAAQPAADEDDGPPRKEELATETPTASDEDDANDDSSASSCKIVCSDDDRDDDSASAASKDVVDGAVAAQPAADEDDGPPRKEELATETTTASDEDDANDDSLASSCKIVCSDDDRDEGDDGEGGEDGDDGGDDDDDNKSIESGRSVEKLQSVNPPHEEADHMDEVDEAHDKISSPAGAGVAGAQSPASASADTLEVDDFMTGVTTTLKLLCTVAECKLYHNPAGPPNVCSALLAPSGDIFRAGDQMRLHGPSSESNKQRTPKTVMILGVNTYASTGAETRLVLFTPSTGKIVEFPLRLFDSSKFSVAPAAKDTDTQEARRAWVIYLAPRTGRRISPVSVVNAPVAPSATSNSKAGIMMVVGRAKAAPLDPEAWRLIQATVLELNGAARARKAASRAPARLPSAFLQEAPSRSAALESAPPQRPSAAPTDNGITPLFAAAWAGHTDVLQALIDSGADVDCAAGGAAPLYGAARHGQLCVLVALLDGGAAVDGTDSRGETPLLAAAERGNWDVARALLAFGADPGLGVDHISGQRTPLRAAVQSGDLGAVRALVRYGAVPKTPVEEDFVEDDVLRLDFQKQKARR